VTAHVDLFEKVRIIIFECVHFYILEGARNKHSVFS